MATHREKAMALFNEGYNCAQAVVLAFCDVTGLDEETALKISSSFGGGMGRLRQVCGAVSGMFMVLGLIDGYTDAKDDNKKRELYTRVQMLAGEFTEENGSIICAQLLGLAPKPQDPNPEKRTDEYYRKRPCGELVGDCAELLDKYLENR